MNIPKFLYVICVGLFSSAFFADISYASDAPRSLPQKKMEQRANTIDFSKKCEGDITLHLYERELTTSIVEGLFVQLVNGTSINPCQDNSLKGKVIRNVRQISWPGFDITDIRDDKLAFVSEYQRAKNLRVSKIPDKNISEILTIPISKKYETIILPYSIHPTLNGEPVAITCKIRSDDLKNKKYPVSNCRTKYLHPSGLRITQYFNRELKPNEYLSEMDIRFRKRLEDMLVK